MTNFQLTAQQKLLELLHFYTATEVAAKTNTNTKTITKVLKGDEPSLIVSLKIDEAFKQHVRQHSVKKTAAELRDSLDKSYLINSPDGFQPVSTFYIKNPRDIVEVNTASHKMLCSADHLIETTDGWVYANRLTERDTVLTKSGEEAVKSVIDTGRHEEVYDLTVEHENHRYWGGSGISSHNSGKSFMAASIAKQAQDAGSHIVYLDSENGIDIQYLKKIGMTIDEDSLTYIQVDTIEDVNRVLSEFFDGYIKEYGQDKEDSPPVLVIIDSLAMLSTETEQENFDKKGEIKADQGIRAKRTKSMLRMLVKKLARINAAAIFTDHVYPQDVMAGDGAWAITNSTKFAPSIIGIVTKLNLKEDTDIVGVRMRFMTYKSRFAKVGTKVELEVPYDRGMSPFTGLEDMLVDMGVIQKEGHSYICNLPSGQIKFKWKDINEELWAKIQTHPKINEDESDENIVDNPLEDDDGTDE